MTAFLLALLVVGLLVATQSRAPADGTSGGGAAVTAPSAGELETEIAAEVEFQTGEPIDPGDVICEPGSSNSDESIASCSVFRSDGLEIPLIASFTDGRVLTDIDPAFYRP